MTRAESLFLLLMMAAFVENSKNSRFQFWVRFVHGLGLEILLLWRHRNFDLSRRSPQTEPDRQIRLDFWFLGRSSLNPILWRMRRNQRYCVRATLRDKKRIKSAFRPSPADGKEQSNERTLATNNKPSISDIVFLFVCLLLLFHCRLWQHVFEIFGFSSLPCREANVANCPTTIQTTIPKAGHGRRRSVSLLVCVCVLIGCAWFCDQERNHGMFRTRLGRWHVWMEWNHFVTNETCLLLAWLQMHIMWHDVPWHGISTIRMDLFEIVSTKTTPIRWYTATWKRTNLVREWERSLEPSPGSGSFGDSSRTERSCWEWNTHGTTEAATDTMSIFWIHNCEFRDSWTNIVSSHKPRKKW